MFRAIDRYNDAFDIDDAITDVNREIRRLRKLGQTPETKDQIRIQYLRLYRIGLQQDYMELVVKNPNDYRKASRSGFYINGVKYVRLLGTTGGIKNSVVVFCSERVHAYLREFLDCGRDTTKELVPAKFGAYEALACSSSVPVSAPRGIIVVPDCMTSFVEDVVTINDGDDGGEPVVAEQDGYEFRHDASDGFGTMTPEQAEVWSRELRLDYVMSGCNTRYAFEKGMLVVFDHIAFAEQVHGADPVTNPDGYLVKDVWGCVRDVRDASVVLTESMLKLWDSYSSMESYLECCNRYGYSFSVTKVPPNKLENTWTTNYQFLQGFDFTDEDIDEFIAPTLAKFDDVFGGDYRKALVYLNGQNATLKTYLSQDNPVIKALMVDPNIINDGVVSAIIRRMIRKQIDEAKMGKIDVHGHFEVACGDPYALWQSIFGLEVTGLLNAGEVYSKYWSDSRSRSVLVFRAPMTCFANIRKMDVAYDLEKEYWYQYIRTMVVFNAWDSSCDALNGEDFDGDMNFLTDDPVLMRNYHHEKTIVCMQRKAAKSVVTDEKLVESNIATFGNEIGQITNRATELYDIRSTVDPESFLYKLISDRIMCMQHYQQCAIDKAKGIKADPMPKSWYEGRFLKSNDDDTVALRFRKYIDNQIVAEQKPHFMIYKYTTLKSQWRKYLRGCQTGSQIKFGKSLSDLLGNFEDLSPEEKVFVRYYVRLAPVSNYNHIVNRICGRVESRYDNKKKWQTSGAYDYHTLLSGERYEQKEYGEAKRVLTDLFNAYAEAVGAMKADGDYMLAEQNAKRDQRHMLESYFREQCIVACPDDNLRVDVLIDICYNAGTRQPREFVWRMCGDDIVYRLLLRTGKICIPMPVAPDEEYDFEYCGNRYIMIKKEVEIDPAVFESEEAGGVDADADLADEN